MPLSVVILAAGQGKRMNSDLPKVLQPLAGEPLLQHVIRTARALDPANIYVVYGHGGAQVQAAFAHEDVDWVLQAEQLGTGHAVMQAMCLIPDDHTVLVLYGDVPLIRPACLEKLVASAGVRARSHCSRSISTMPRATAASCATRRRPRERHRRAQRRHPRAAADPRGQLRSHGRAGGPAARLAVGARSKQRAARVLPDRCGRRRRAGRESGRGDTGRRRAVEVLGVNDKLQLAQVEAGLRRCAPRS